MAVGSVTVTQQNTNSGSISEVERTALFIGLAGASAVTDAVHAIGSDTDLDVLLGSEESDLKTNIKAAILEAGNNFTGYAVALGALTWDTAIDMAVDTPYDLNVEFIVLTDPITEASKVTAFQTKADEINTTFAKLVTIHAATSAIASDQTWSDYMAAQAALQTDLVADRVSLVPQLHGNNLGCVIGRMMDDSLSIGDSPMRVASGAFAYLGEAPVDSDGTELTMAHIKQLAGYRLSVPQWYAGYDGIYWADHPVLDAEGGDFQVIEYRRILDYVARRVRMLAIPKIADRSLNSSESSIVFHQSYFMQPIKAAAKEVVINDETKPGMVEQPEEGDITIVWTDSTSVAIYMQAAPLDCPKKISAYISLDL